MERSGHVFSSSILFTFLFGVVGDEKERSSFWCCGVGVGKEGRERGERDMVPSFCGLGAVFLDRVARYPTTGRGRQWIDGWADLSARTRKFV
jgi:hypothetical protein